MAERTHNGKRLVIGASRGIGRAISVELARCGYYPIINYRSDEAGAVETLKMVTEQGAGGEIMAFDVTDFDAVQSAVGRIIADHGTIDALVNNAGITRDNLLMRMKDDEWDAVIDTNLGSVYRLSKACIRGMMKARRGRIINIGSVVGATGNPGQANYCAAKAGMIGFTKSLARELGSRGITVNAVAPGFIDTDMTRALPAEQRETLIKQIPAGRLGTPQDIAAAVVFLASSAAAYITGDTLHVNGGMHMA